MKAIFSFQIRQNFPWCAVVVLLLTVFPLTSVSAATPADPNASAKTKAVLNYLSRVPSKPDHRLISGQWGSWGSVTTTDIQKIYDITNPHQWVGLVAADYQRTSNRGMSVGTVNPAMIDYWNKGALIEIGNQFQNPETGGASTDTEIKNFAAITISGTVSYNNFMAELDRVAVGLQELENAGVTVLFRPFPEMNGDWFWWSAGDNANFKKLWIQTFNYLTNTKGLHNLLWVYASMPYNPSCINYYPGSQYVDITGFSLFGYKGDKPACYDEQVALGKPFALDQFGRQSSQWTVKEPPEDLSQAIQWIKQYMPKAVYVLAWNDHWDISYQLNVSPALNNPWVQNRPVPYGSSTTPPPSPRSSPSPHCPVVLIDTDIRNTLTTWWNLRETDTSPVCRSHAPHPRNKLADLATAGFAYCFIDSPPAMTDQNENILKLADTVLIPTRPTPADLWSLGATIDLLNKAGVPFAFIFTQAKDNAKLTLQTVSALPEFGSVLQAIIHDRVDYAASMTDGRTVTELNPSSPAAAGTVALWLSVRKKIDEKTNSSKNEFALPSTMNAGME